MARINPGEYRLNEAALQQLEMELSQPIVTGQTTDLQAGYLLGIQLVLKKLRDGFTVPAA